LEENSPCRFEADDVVL